MGQESIATIVLAAGQGRRFGGDKLLTTLPCGQAVIVQTLQTLLPEVERLVCVVRRDDFKLRDLLDQMSLCHKHLECLPIDNADQGMSASLQAGIEHCHKAEGWLIALGDMPYVKPETLRLLHSAFQRELSRGRATCILRPRHKRRQQWGQPVLFTRYYYPELQNISGDKGARDILTQFAHQVIAVDVNDDGVLVDIDRPADLI